MLIFFFSVVWYESLFVKYSKHTRFSKKWSLKLFLSNRLELLIVKFYTCPYHVEIVAICNHFDTIPNRRTEIHYQYRAGSMLMRDKNDTSHISLILTTRCLYFKCTQSMYDIQYFHSMLKTDLLCKSCSQQTDSPWCPSDFVFHDCQRNSFTCSTFFVNFKSCNCLFIYLFICVIFDFARSVASIHCKVMGPSPSNEECKWSYSFKLLVLYVRVLIVKASYQQFSIAGTIITLRAKLRSVL